MERVAKLLRLSKITAACLTPEALAQAGWRAVLGKRKGVLTQPGRLENGTLRVHVTDEVWLMQLSALRPQILSRISEVIGPGIVTGLEFRLMPARLGPRQETRPVRGDAEGIEDPELSRIYQAKVKRATA
jgi:predicted nucleic acid-binding Zn ribbon protein